MLRQKKRELVSGEKSSILINTFHLVIAECAKRTQEALESGRILKQEGYTFDIAYTSLLGARPSNPEIDNWSALGI